MKGYPAGTTVTVFANPNFISEGKDNAWSTNTGYVPNDGCLDAEPRTCLFSTRDRAEKLQGQNWYWGYPDDSCFLDNAHQVGMEQFLHCYLKSQGAALCHFGPSFASAATAMREGGTDAVSDKEPDLTKPAGMTQMVQKEPEEKVGDAEDTTDKKGDGDKGGVTKTDESTDTKKEEEHKEVAETSEDDESAKERDEFGNPKDKDLLKTGSMKGTRLMYVTTSSEGYVDNSPLIDALSEKGFSVTQVKYPLPTLADWKALLAKNDQVWLFSTGKSQALSRGHVEALAAAWKSGVDLCLEGDNTPLYQDVNAVLALICPGSKLDGFYEAEKVIGAQSSPTDVGFDAKHPVFFGIENFWEGTTTSKVILAGKLKSICRDSAKDVLIAALDPSGGQGRVLVHGGFTTFFKTFMEGKPGAARLGVNMAGWLGGVGK